MSELLELAARVEAAAAADRELDALIRCAVFAPAGAYVKQSPINGAWCIYETGHGGRERNWETRGLSQEQRVGSFTASLDAAMTLVPNGHRLFSLGEARYMTRSPAFSAQLEVWTCADGVDGSEHRAIGVAATPALALTAAALRAHASQQMMEGIGL